MIEICYSLHTKVTCLNNITHLISQIPTRSPSFHKCQKLRQRKLRRWSTAKCEMLKYLQEVFLHNDF